MFANAISLTGDQVGVQANGQMLGPVNIEIAQATPLEVKTVEELVREYFKDNPELVAVAWCESRFRQFDGAGEIHRGIVNSNDIGVMQINTTYHAERAHSLGIDLYTLEGNMAYAKYLYESEGLQPWSASEPCWRKYMAKDIRVVAFVENN